MTAYHARIKQLFSVPFAVPDRIFWGAAAAIFCLALFLRASLAEPHPLRTDTDVAQYVRLGAAIANDFRMYDIYPEDISAARGPLFPVFIALAGKISSFRIADIALAQALLNAFCALLVCWAAAKLHSRLCGLLAAFLFAVNPAQIQLVSIPMIESFYTFVVLSAACSLIYLSEKPCAKRAAVCGLVFGGGLLCRSALLFFPPLIAAALAVLKPKAWRSSAMLVLGFSYIFTVPWAARNYHHFGAPVFFEQYTATDIMYTGVKGVDVGLTGSAMEKLAAAEIKELGKLPPALRERALKKEILRGVFSRPFHFLRGVARRFFKYAGALLVLAGWPAFILALAAFLWNRKKTCFVFLAGLSFYFPAVHSLMSVSERYLYPSLPVLSILTAVGLITLYERLKISIWKAPAGPGAEPAVSNLVFHAGAAFIIVLCCVSVTVMAVEALTVPAGRTARFQNEFLPGFNTALSEIAAHPRQAASVFTGLLNSDIAVSGAISGKILSARGVAYLLAGDIPKARGDFAGAVTAAPALYETYLSLASLELMGKDRSRAAAALDSGLNAAARAAASGTDFTCEEAAVLKKIVALRESLPLACGGIPLYGFSAAFGKGLASRYVSCSRPL